MLVKVICLLCRAEVRITVVCTVLYGVVRGCTGLYAHLYIQGCKYGVVQWCCGKKIKGGRSKFEIESLIIEYIEFGYTIYILSVIETIYYYLYSIIL